MCKFLFFPLFLCSKIAFSVIFFLLAKFLPPAFQVGMCLLPLSENIFIKLRIHCCTAFPALEKVAPITGICLDAPPTPDAPPNPMPRLRSRTHTLSLWLLCFSLSLVSTDATKACLALHFFRFPSLGFSQLLESVDLHPCIFWVARPSLGGALPRSAVPSPSSLQHDLCDGTCCGLHATLGSSVENLTLRGTVFGGAAPRVPPLGTVGHRRSWS